MANKVARLNIIIENGRGFQALQYACALAADIKESQPWNDEASELVEALLTVAEEMRPIPAIHGAERAWPSDE